MEFGAQQSTALERVAQWLGTRGGPQLFRLFGYAGTGKTTIAKEVAGQVRGRVPFCAYTGKAALVLRSKGAPGASTIHSLIYKPEDDPETGKVRFVLNEESPIRGSALVIVDECSMVDETLAHDLMSYGTRILVLGDPAQLPPVKGAGYFTNAEPDFMLTDIHRQALDNPIIAMSMRVRQGEGLQLGTYGECKVIRRPQLQPGEVMAADQVLCGLNNTRRGLNHRFRDKLGYTTDYPSDGDRLVCLKNDREKQLFNGGLWIARQPVHDEVKRLTKLKVESIDLGGPLGLVDVEVPVEYFHGTEKNLPYGIQRAYEAFDFGYALTVHKGQGSQWPNVMLFDESSIFREHRERHLYTGLTRAAEKITIVV